MRSAEGILESNKSSQEAKTEKSNPTKPTVRALVVIASFGEKNIGFLKSVIQNYRSMALDTDIVVVSDAPKNLGNSARVAVGLPSKNPWSLPFAHKRIFAEHASDYDLFIYSEDDIGVTEQNIRAFLELTTELKPDEIPGFLRYEVDPQGAMSLPEVHGTFHWKPESVQHRGRDVIAEFTNEHAGFYILTQSQLKQAMDSGGFLKEPYEGRFGMLETAATDPYTSCGFRKVICISRLRDFLIHHLPNKYVGHFGVSISDLNAQIQRLTQIGNGAHLATTLCETESKLSGRKWSKGHYERPSEELLSLFPENARTILSVGSGHGALESQLRNRGARVTTLPLNSVCDSAAEDCGNEVINGTLDQCFSRLGTRQFDCIVLTNLLHLLPAPWSALEKCVRVTKSGGTLLVGGPNFSSFRVWAKRLFSKDDYRKLRNFADSGVHPLTTSAICRRLKRAGFQIAALKFPNGSASRSGTKMGRLIADEWIICAKKQ